MHSKTRAALGIVATAFLMLAGAAFADQSPASTPPSLRPTRVSGTIVDVAVGNADFSTLVAALSDANLVTTLEGKGPFTVFAPTNAAFAKIPPAILNYLLANPNVLSQVLLYHVATGEQRFDFDFLPDTVGTVQGEKLFARIVWDSGRPVLKINNSTLVLSPIIASNGIIYVIDSVLLPQF